MQMCTVLLKHSIYRILLRIRLQSPFVDKNILHTHTHTLSLSVPLASACIYLYTYRVSSAPATLLSAGPFRYSQKDSVARTRGGYARTQSCIPSIIYIRRPRPQRVYIHRIFTVKGSCGNAGTEGAPLRIMPEKAFL